MDIRTIFNQKNIADRQVSELIGLAHGMLADGKIDEHEAEYLYKWLVANSAASENPVISKLLERVGEMLEDGHLDAEEGQELMGTLHSLVGGDFELGELLKSTSLPLTNPVPEIIFSNHIFCFTGTFAFGKRKDCEQQIIERAGKIGNLNANLNYLVIGIYATDSWAQSSWGRKIEKAISLNEKSANIKIISEADWVERL